MAEKSSETSQLDVLYMVAYVIYVILAFILTILVLPFLLLLSLIFRIYRHTQIRKIKATYPDALIVAGEDACWFQDTIENPGIINCLVHFQGQHDIVRLQRLIMQRVVEAKDEYGKILFPKVTRFGAKRMSRYVWLKEDDFDINDHTYLYKGDIPKNKAEIQKIVSDIASQPLPPRKSAWQFIIIPYPENDKPSFLLMFRAHHSIADGMSLMRMIMKSLMDRPPDELLPQRFGSVGMWKKMCAAFFLGPAILLGKLFWARDQNLLHGPEPTGKKMLAWSDPIDLKFIKKIKNSLGATVNDVLMSCLGGAFNRYIRSVDGEIPENMSLYVPVDISPSDAEASLDNKFGLVFLSLPINIKDNVERLHLTKERMDAIKRSPEPIIAALTIKYCMNRLPKWLTQVSFDWFTNKCSVLMSNVPGPQTPLTFGGHSTSGLIFWPPQRKEVAMGVSILSFNGEVRIGVMVDECIRTDPNKIVSAFVDQVHELAKEQKLE